MILRVLSRRPTIFNSKLRWFYSIQEFKQLSQSKQHYKILGLDEDPSSLYMKKLHRAYLAQIKKYHADMGINQKQKKQNQEICKIIIQSYQALKTKLNESQRKVVENEEQELKQDISRTLFGKSYKQIRHILYQQGKEEMRANFVRELKAKQKVRNNDQFSQQRSQQNSSNQFRSPPPQQNQQHKAASFLIGFGVLSILSYFFYIWTGGKKRQAIPQTKNLAPQNKVRSYTQAQLDMVQENMVIIQVLKYQKIYNKINKYKPHMLIYPDKKEPSIFQQLAKYSIAPDIHLYEVDSNLFVDKNVRKQLKDKNSIDHIETYQMTQTRPTTLLTLSLQAERCFHSVFIRVDDILEQIKQTGKFTPPKVFFRFYGYFMVELRDMPFSSLQSYRNTPFISLFDLYFDYYSPIFFKRNYYTDWLYNPNKQETKKYHRYFGQCHINHRRLDVQYLKKGQKVAIMKSDKNILNPLSGKLNSQQIQYKKLWTWYYKKIQKQWKKYCQHEITQEIPLHPIIQYQQQERAKKQMAQRLLRK